MKKGEQALFKVKSNYAYGEKGNSAIGIPPNTDIVYQITMHEFTKEKEYWELNTFSEKEDAAMRRKNEGNKFFSDNNFHLAILKYKKAIDLFNYESGLSEQEKSNRQKRYKIAFLLEFIRLLFKDKRVQRCH